jgi:hypothetical protein
MFSDPMESENALAGMRDGVLLARAIVRPEDPPASASGLIDWREEVPRRRS